MKCENIFIEYEPSDTIEKQGKRGDIQKYLKKGYYIKEERNGYWVLVKSSKVIINISNSSGNWTFDIKQDILDFYEKKKISEKLVEKFKQDIKDDKVSIYMDEKGNYDIR